MAAEIIDMITPSTILFKNVSKISDCYRLYLLTGFYSHRWFLLQHLFVHDREIRKKSYRFKRLSSLMVSSSSKVRFDT